MNLLKAIEVINNFAPCHHDSYHTDLGDGTIWAKCDDCGEIFAQKNIHRYQQQAKKFEEAVDCLQSIANSVI